MNRHPFVEKLMINMYLLASFLMGGIYVTVEMILVLGFVTALQKNDSSSMLACAVYWVLVPLFLLLGIPIAVNEGIKPKNKMLFVPFLTVGLMFGVVPVGNMIIRQTAFTTMAYLVISGPPAAVFFWLFMTLINFYRRRLFYFLMIMGCLFFWVPVYIFLGFSSTQIFADLQSLFTLLFIIFAS
jgi:hypothetical protein